MPLRQAPNISDREIVERLTRLEEGQNAILREINNRFEAVDAQSQQFREDMNKQFDRMANIFFGILAAFVAMFAGTIMFALWDRRTMIRPFEDKVKKIEDEISKDRGKLHSLIESFRALGKTDENVVAILKRFNLL